MSQCITATPTSISVMDLQDSGAFVYTVKVDSAVPQIRIYFTPPRNATASGTIDGVVVTPSGPSVGSDWVEFNTSQIGTEYTVQVSYTNPPPTQESTVTPPLETPTKSPKFKPQSTCPTS